MDSSSALGYTNVDLKISLHVYVHVKITAVGQLPPSPTTLNLNLTITQTVTLTGGPIFVGGNCPDTENNTWKFRILTWIICPESLRNVSLQANRTFPLHSKRIRDLRSETKGFRFESRCESEILISETWIFIIIWLYFAWK